MFTQNSKTNWRFLSIVIIFTAIASVGILVYQYWRMPKEEVKLPELIKPIEKTSSPVCKNQCGDGICQEIVCLAVGCPCPETKESCSQDCGEEQIKQSVSCIEGIIFAQNPYDGECKKFTSSCQVSEGWIKITNCDNPYAGTKDLMKDAVEPSYSLPIKTEIIKYETEEGTVDIEIIEGEAIVLFDPKILPETAEKLIILNNGEVIGKIPTTGSYNVKVKPGTVMEFIKKMSIYLVRNVTPNVLLQPLK